MPPCAEVVAQPIAIFQESREMRGFFRSPGDGAVPLQSKECFAFCIRTMED